MRDLVATSHPLIKDAFNHLRKHRADSKRWPARRHAQGICWTEELLKHSLLYHIDQKLRFKFQYIWYFHTLNLGFNSQWGAIIPSSDNKSGENQQEPGEPANNRGHRYTMLKQEPNQLSQSREEKMDGRARAGAMSCLMRISFWKKCDTRRGKKNQERVRFNSSRCSGLSFLPAFQWEVLEETLCHVETKPRCSRQPSAQACKLFSSHLAEPPGLRSPPLRRLLSTTKPCCSHSHTLLPG